MKTTKILIIIPLVIMALSLLNGCGGGDEASPSNTTGIVDGVHVNARKLKSLNVGGFIFNMSYDTQGRLTSIVWTNFDNSNSLTNCTIDYDLRVVEYISGLSMYSGMTVSEAFKYKKSRVIFTLNDQGYISQIGNCSLTYNSNGYLVGVNTKDEVFSYAYNNGDMVKSMVESLRYGDIKIYYIEYEDKPGSGEIIFYIKGDQYLSDLFLYSSNYQRGIAILAAYQAGLFGKTSHHFTELPNNTNKNYIIDILNRQQTEHIKITCTCKFE